MEQRQPFQITTPFLRHKTTTVEAQVITTRRYTILGDYLGRLIEYLGVIKRQRMLLSKTIMLKFIHIVSESFALTAILIALIYGALAKTWLRALLVVMASGIVASVFGVYEIILAADGKQNILAVFTFPINILFIVFVARGIKLAACSSRTRGSQARKYTNRPPPMPPL